jgi:hypothetical protein
MDSKLITSWVTIWGINDLSLGVSTNQSFKPLWTPPNSLSFSPSWMNRSSKAPNVLLQLLKTFGQMFQARSFKPQGLRGGSQYGARSQYGKAGGKKPTAGRSKNRGLREVRDQFLCKFQDFSSVSWHVEDSQHNCAPQTLRWQTDLLSEIDAKLMNG